MVTRTGWRMSGMVLVAVGALASTTGAQQRFKSGVDLVHFSVVVTDKQGTPISGLTKEDFQVVEEGTNQTISFFMEGDPKDGENLGEALPLHLGLALDSSGSMEADIRDVRSAMVKFLLGNTAAIDVTLVDFDTEVRVALFPAADYPRVIERIRMKKPGGWTAFYDAIAKYIEGAAALDGQKILLIYTDAGDTRSVLRFDELLDRLKFADVTVYAIGYLENQRSSDRNTGRSVLQKMAQVTGGEAFFPSSLKELDKIYEKIQTEIAARYSLGYLSTDTRANGRWRKVEIKLLRPDLKGAKIRTRGGYFAPFKEGGA
jgi:Ca-activated chloride channel family protein